jgi:hypothetical protein
LLLTDGASIEHLTAKARQLVGERYSTSSISSSVFCVATRKLISAAAVLDVLCTAKQTAEELFLQTKQADMPAEMHVKDARAEYKKLSAEQQLEWRERYIQKVLQQLVLTADVCIVVSNSTNCANCITAVQVMHSSITNRQASLVC